MEKLLTTVDIMRKLKPKKSGNQKISRQYISHLIKIGKIPAQKYGRDWFIKESDFLKFVEKYGYELRD